MPMLRPSTPGTAMSASRHSPMSPNRRTPMSTRNGVAARPETTASMAMAAPRQSETTTGAANG